MAHHARETGPRLVARAWAVLAPPLATAFRPSIVAAVGLIVGALVPLAWLTSAPPFCPFKATTGLPCPGCGLTRAAVACLQGDLAASLHFHPLGVPLVLAVAAIGLIDAWAWWRARRGARLAPAPAWILERLFATPAPWFGIAVLALVWLVRLPLYVAGVWIF